MNSYLDNLSPLDGRYAAITAPLREFCSERALINQRLRLECLWLLHLNRHTGNILTAEQVRAVQACAQCPPPEAAVKIKKIEQRTAHDVKAVEYFLRTHFEQQFPANDFVSYLHFGLTSEDINNLAFATMFKDALQRCLLPRWQEVVKTLQQSALAWAEVVIPAHTHGQPASPTTMGKELAVFCMRLQRQLRLLQNLPLYGKLNGATGNYHALHIAFPQHDWPAISRAFVEETVGVTFNPLTTQSEDHDALIVICDRLSHLHAITKGLCQDLWTYISLSWFKLKITEDEVGSSVMPQKVNPIDFENAEGNLGLANAAARHFSEKLAVSRLQRDLSDSTVMRAVGTMFGHSLIACTSVLRGMGRLELNHNAITTALERDWSVLGEAVQTIMRKNNIADAYEAVKKFSRGQTLTAAQYRAYVASLTNLPPAEREKLQNLTPATYAGRAQELARTVAEL